jgi:Protein of unknown function (DUF3800)
VGGPTVAPGFIRELCLALAHRVEPERLFVILTVYMDESGTHRGSPCVAVASAMANVRQWGEFQKGLDKLKREFGFSVLHMKDFKAGKGEFKGWTREKGFSLITDLTNLATDTLMYSADFVIDESAYKEFKRDLPSKIRVDSRYGLGFRICLSAQVEEIYRRLSHHKKFSEARLHVVMESGCSNAGDAKRIYDETKGKLKSASPFLASLTFSAKSEADPLMFADFLAHSAYIKGPEKRDHTASSATMPRREKGRIVHFSFDADGIQAVKRKLIDELEARRAWGARRPVSADEQPD